MKLRAFKCGRTKAGLCTEIESKEGNLIFKEDLRAWLKGAAPLLKPQKHRIEKFQMVCGMSLAMDIKAMHRYELVKDLLVELEEGKK